MTQEEWENKLHQEGFSRTYVWKDAPGTFYSDHTHEATTAHVILEGQMTLTSEGQTRTYQQGDRCDVPARTLHSARMGPEGCCYLIGEK